MGKTKLMLHSLGSTTESAYLPGTQLLSPYLSGEVGLLCTSRPPPEIEAFFATYATLDYARAGTTAPRAFRLEPGPLTTRYGVEGGADEPIPISEEPRLRKLGVPSRLVKGTVCLEEAAEDGVQEGGYTVCQEGDVLDSRQTTLLKIFGVRMAEFRIQLRACWEKSAEQVRKIGAMET